MHVADSILAPVRQGPAEPTVAHRLGGRLGLWARALVRGWERRQALLAWNRSLPRPPHLAHVPDRVWQRHSALLSQLGQAPDRGAR
jgi:hypothetical protein